MGKIKKYHFNLSITTIIVESVSLPLALFLLFAQLWGLIMRKGSLPETFWKVIPMDIKAAWELYAVAFSILGFWAWLRIRLYKKNQKKEKAREKREKQTAKILDALWNRVKKEKSESTSRRQV